ncbi:hypothetical protein L208DRAFT_1359336, partial [Tricholoma matsutake]
MLRVSPLVFLTVLDLIENHTVFRNDTNLGQTPIEQQLADYSFPNWKVLWKTTQMAVLKQSSPS